MLFGCDPTFSSDFEVDAIKSAVVITNGIRRLSGRPSGDRHPLSDERFGNFGAGKNIFAAHLIKTARLKITRFAADINVEGFCSELDALHLAVNRRRRLCGPRWIIADSEI